MRHQFIKATVVLLLAPICLFFLSCCCLKDEAQAAEKSKCGACTKTKSTQDQSHNQDNCPHAKVKAVKDNAVLNQLIFKMSLMPLLILRNEEVSLLYKAKSFIVPQFTAPPLQSSLDFHNPILRV